MPASGYLPSNPCGGGGGGAGGRGGGGGRGGAPGPHVAPGSYSVALVADGSEVDRKPMTVIMDPEVRFTVAERQRYDTILEELHDVQRRGTAVAAALTAITAQMSDIAGRIGGMSNVSGDARSQFDALNRDFESVRVKFGVQAPGEGGRGAGGGRGGGGGGRGGGGDPANVLNRLSTVKGAIMGIWEMPSEAVVAQANQAGPALNAAIDEANGVLARARSVSQQLGQYGLTLTVPPATN
jgi:hypothetical protein